MRKNLLRFVHAAVVSMCLHVCPVLWLTRLGAQTRERGGQAHYPGLRLHFCSVFRAGFHAYLGRDKWVKRLRDSLSLKKENHQSMQNSLEDEGLTVTLWKEPWIQSTSLLGLEGICMYLQPFGCLDASLFPANLQFNMLLLLRSSSPNLTHSISPGRNVMTTKYTLFFPLNICWAITFKEKQRTGELLSRSSLSFSVFPWRQISVCCNSDSFPHLEHSKLFQLC